MHPLGIEADAFLADSVVVAEGKLYSQGAGWNIITTRTTPVRHGRIGIGVLVRVPYTSTNQQHQFEIRLEDADGQRLPIGDNPQGDGKIDGFGGQFNVGRPPHLQPGDEQILPFALNIDGIVFDQPGRYRFVVVIDGQETKELPFRVSVIEQA